MGLTSEWTIYYDHLQEGTWFQALDERLEDAVLEPLSEAFNSADLSDVLEYDRPDILLTHSEVPVLVVERTVEVPSGHNVGQRFARLAAAAEQQVPLVYFGPFKARKHGGATEGPRYMNLRLFYALDQIEAINSAAVSTVNWPVDDECELLLTPSKDDQMREYVATLMDIVLADDDDRRKTVERIRATPIYRRLLNERKHFEETGVTNPKQYDKPPPSVRLLGAEQAAREFGASELVHYSEVVAYKVGMNNVRSDPYTGMSMLYRYLYVLSHEEARALVLEFPGIDLAKWRQAASTGRDRKDIRLYRLLADGIAFSDGYRRRGHF